MFGLFGSCCCEQATDKPSDTRKEVEQVNVFPDQCVSYDPEGANVTYTSDVEGRWDTFCNFADNSQGLKFCNEMTSEERRCGTDLDMELKDGWHFVYGGDATTKGAGTLRFYETMVRLKKQYPGRVHLLIVDKDTSVEGWRLDDAEFESRRQEIAILNGLEPDQVSDDDVYQNIEEQSKPDGWMWEYLQLVQLAVMLGDKLFMHGEILSSTISVEDVCISAKHQEMLKAGMVPEDDGVSEEMQSWLARVNQWTRNQIRQWELLS